jgi:hypothetical protein
MTKVQLMAKLPVGDANGLAPHADEFIDDPGKMRLALAVITRKRRLDDDDDLEVTAIVRILRIEIIERPEDVQELQRIMLRANEERSGQPMLPYETEKAINEAFKDFVAEAGSDDE